MKVYPQTSNRLHTLIIALSSKKESIIEINSPILYEKDQNIFIENKEGELNILDKKYNGYKINSIAPLIDELGMIKYICRVDKI